MNSQKIFDSRSTNSAALFQTPQPFYATQIINSILYSRISVNYDKELGFKLNREILLLLNVPTV